MPKSLLLFLTFFTATLTSWANFTLPRDSSQLLVGVSDSWNSSYATLTLYQKTKSGWQPVLQPWKGRLGRNGSIWGRGIHSNPTGAKLKKEGDGRSPAGVFRIGGAWGYAPTAKKHPETAYTQITPRHLWVEDSSSPHYNRQIILDRNPSSSWEKKQQMRQGDYAHSLKIFIAHNAFPSPVPNAGSAIFFHIWRGGGSKSTAGCTTMAEPQLRTLLANLNPKARPLYVLLPKAEYQKLRQSWKLP